MPEMLQKVAVLILQHISSGGGLRRLVCLNAKTSTSIWAKLCCSVLHPALKDDTKLAASERLLARQNSRLPSGKLGEGGRRYIDRSIYLV